MTPAELREARRKLGLTQPQLAAALHVNVRTVAGWELGTRNGKPTGIPQIVALAIEALIRRNEK